MGAGFRGIGARFGRVGVIFLCSNRFPGASSARCSNVLVYFGSVLCNFPLFLCSFLSRLIIGQRWWGTESLDFAVFYKPFWPPSRGDGLWPGRGVVDLANHS